MTNLVEKSLITGFGIFTLILFISIFSPFMETLSEYKDNQEGQDLNDYLKIINIFDVNIEELIKNPQNDRKFSIFLPKKFNISTFRNFIGFEFTYNDKKYDKIIEYEVSFLTKQFKIPEGKIYDIEIIFKERSIDLRMI